MRWQRRAAEQSNGFAHSLGKIFQLYLTRGLLFAVEEERGAEPTIFQPKRIEFGVAAHEYDWNLPAMRPAQNSADAP